MKKHLYFLSLLSKTHPFQQRALLEAAEPHQVGAICEYTYNIVHGYISIPEGTKEEFVPRKQMLRDLADTKVPYTIKKEVLLQGRGSILGALIPPAISAILGFISNLKK